MKNVYLTRFFAYKNLDSLNTSTNSNLKYLASQKIMLDKDKIKEAHITHESLESNLIIFRDSTLQLLVNQYLIKEQQFYYKKLVLVNVMSLDAKEININNYIFEHNDRILEISVFFVPTQLLLKSLTVKELLFNENRDTLVHFLLINFTFDNLIELFEKNSIILSEDIPDNCVNNEWKLCSYSLSVFMTALEANIDLSKYDITLPTFF